MRIIPIFATLLVAGLPAGAQVRDECRGDTVSALADCVIDPSPPVIEQIEEGEAPTVPGTGPTRMGGPLEPQNLRTDRRAPTPSNSVQAGQVLNQGYQELVAPEDYGFAPATGSDYYAVGDRAVRVNRETREIMEVRPLAGIGSGPVGDTPGIGVRGTPRLDAGEAPEIGIGETNEPEGLDDATPEFGRGRSVEPDGVADDSAGTLGVGTPGAGGLD